MSDDNGARVNYKTSIEKKYEKLAELNRLFIPEIVNDQLKFYRSK